MEFSNTQNNKLELNIGVDFGGVLSLSDEEGSDFEAFNVPYSLEVLTRLKNLGCKLFLISFCGKPRAYKCKEKIEAIAPRLFDELYFLKNKKFKKDICKNCNCDVMIDDRLDILEDIEKNVTDIKLICFKGDPKYVEENVKDGSKIVLVKDWDIIKKDGDTLEKKCDTIEKIIKNTTKTRVLLYKDIDIRKKCYDLTADVKELK